VQIVATVRLTENDRSTARLGLLPADWARKIPAANSDSVRPMSQVSAP
jgi:hypothetical protein